MKEQIILLLKTVENISSFSKIAQRLFEGIFQTIKVTWFRLKMLIDNNTNLLFVTLILKQIPFINIACLNCSPISNLYLPNGISSIMASISATIPYPLDTLSSIVSFAFPFLFTWSPRYFSCSDLFILLSWTLRSGQHWELFPTCIWLHFLALSFNFFSSMNAFITELIWTEASCIWLKPTWQQNAY